MSVIVIGRMAADPAAIKRLFEERKSDFVEIAGEAKAAGAIHHRWGFGDGSVTIIDEWPDADSFNKFFAAQAKIGQLMQAAGVKGPPQFDIFHAVAAPDEF